MLLSPWSPTQPRQRESVLMRPVLPKNEVDRKLVVQEKGDVQGYMEEMKQFWQRKKDDFLRRALIGPSKWKEADGRGIVTTRGWQFCRGWLLWRMFLWWRIRDGVVWILVECCLFVLVDNRPLWTVSRFDSPVHVGDVRIVFKSPCADVMSKLWIQMENQEFGFMVIKIKPWKQIYLEKLASYLWRGWRFRGFLSYFTVEHRVCPKCSWVYPHNEKTI